MGQLIVLGYPDASEAEEARRFQLQLSNGESLSQQRWVPLGSNWPSNRSGDVPKPSVVLIRRRDGQALLS